MSLSAESSGSPQADEILHDHRRILAVLKQTDAVSTPAPKPAPIQPGLPKDELIVPRNPLVR
jgi:hypothetical protein